MVTISKQSCRVCLSNDYKSTDLFESTKHEGSLIKELYFNLIDRSGKKPDSQPNTHKEQSYPKYVCQKCKQSIIYLKNFIDDCVQNEEILQSIFNESKNQKAVDIVFVEVLDESNKITGHEYFETRDSVSDETILQIDSIVQANKGRFLCTICNNQFVSKYDLKRHCYRHFNIEIDRPKCDICKKSFKHHMELKNHVNSYHPLENISLLCKKCNKKFYNKLSYKIHTLTYHNRKNNVTKKKLSTCDICGVKVHRLDIHADIHRSSQDYFRCDLCPEKSYRRKAQLRVHIKTTHMKLKLRKCHFCEMRFSNSVSKTTHEVLQHDLEYPYKCSKCSYKCCPRYLYLKHMKLHRDIK